MHGFLFIQSLLNRYNSFFPANQETVLDKDENIFKGTIISLILKKIRFRHFLNSCYLCENYLGLSKKIDSTYLISKVCNLFLKTFIIYFNIEFSTSFHINKKTKKKNQKKKKKKNKKKKKKKKKKKNKKKKKKKK